MATSSIFTNFTINDKKTATRFANALDAASQQPEWKKQEPINRPLRDPIQIKELMMKAKKAANLGN